MVIPYQKLSPEALRGVIEEFVTRAGTELTDADVKIEQVRRQLEQGKLVITFDAGIRTCNIVPADRPVHPTPFPIEKAPPTSSPIP